MVSEVLLAEVLDDDVVDARFLDHIVGVGGNNIVVPGGDNGVLNARLGDAAGFEFLHEVRTNSLLTISGDVGVIPHLLPLVVEASSLDERTNTVEGGAVVRSN